MVKIFLFSILLFYRPKLRCLRKVQKICNYLGSYCHAEVLLGRKRRSVERKGLFCLYLIELKNKLWFSFTLYSV